MTKTLYLPVLNSDQYILLTAYKEEDLPDDWASVPEDKIKYVGLSDMQVTSAFLPRNILEFLSDTDPDWRLRIHTYLSEFAGTMRGLCACTEVKIAYRSLDSNILMLKLIL